MRRPGEGNSLKVIFLSVDVSEVVVDGEHSNNFGGNGGPSDGPGVEVGDLPDEPREVLLVGAVHDDPRSAVVAHHLHPALDRVRRGDLFGGEIARVNTTELPDGKSCNHSYGLLPEKVPAETRRIGVGSGEPPCSRWRWAGTRGRPSTRSGRACSLHQSLHYEEGRF